MLLLKKMFGLALWRTSAELFKEENLETEVHGSAIPDEYVEHGNVSVLRKEVWLCADTIVEQIVEADRKQRERA